MTSAFGHSAKVVLGLLALAGTCALLSLTNSQAVMDARLLFVNEGDGWTKRDGTTTTVAPEKDPSSEKKPESDKESGTESGTESPGLGRPGDRPTSAPDASGPTASAPEA